MNEIDYGRWNEWDGLSTEGNLKNMNKNCGLKKMRWNMNNNVWTEGKEMKHEQWSEEDWGKWNVTMSATK